MAAPDDTLEKSSKNSMHRRIGTLAAVVLCVLAVGIGGILAGLFAAGGGKAVDAWLAGVENALAPAPEPTPIGAEPKASVIDLPILILNRAPPQSGHMRLRIAVVIEPHHGDLLGERQPYLLDMLHAYLPELTDTDLRGSAGLTRLRFDLRHRFNLILDREIVSDVLIQELLIK